MNLTSPIFIFIYIPMVLIFYRLTPERWKQLVLVLFGILFSAWAGPSYSLLLIGSIIFNHFSALLIRRSSGNGRSVLFWVAVGGNVALLVWYKHVASTNGLLPLGISFYTFLAISYLADIYMGIALPSQGICQTALYFSFFPRFTAGPLVRYKDFSAQADICRFSSPEFSEGVKRFILGLSRKTLLATPLILAADRIMSQPGSVLESPIAWMGAVFFTLAIYHDFAGYTDMAIGLGLMLGYRLPENFDFPYGSGSFTEFWRRWHITLSSWLRDYLFYPLTRILITTNFRKRLAEGSATMLGRTCLSLCLVFAICGLWHGWGVSFIIWGLFHGLMLSFELTPVGKRLLKAPVLMRRIYFLLLITLSWIPFKLLNFDAITSYLRALLTLGRIDSLYMQVDNYTFFVALVALLFSFPISLKTVMRCPEKLRSAFMVPGYLILFILSLAAVAGNSIVPFIYARF